MATLYQRNRKLVLAKEEYCAICGQYVDKELKTPHPMSAEVDHIIPKDKGGSDGLSNLQLTHRKCNRAKSNKLGYVHKEEKKKARFEQLVNFINKGGDRNARSIQFCDNLCAKFSRMVNCYIYCR